MKYQGSYVNSIKRVLTASLVSGQNAIITSPPGWGKTEISLAFARDSVGEGNFAFVPLDPSTPPERVRGFVNPAALIDPVNPRYELITKGTASDPDAKIVVLDELWRSNEVVFDELIHLTSPKMLADPSTRPVFWGTSNWTIKAERQDALRDRFALWLYLRVDLGNTIAPIVESYLGNGTTSHTPNWDDLPDWNRVLEIRRAKPGAELVKATYEVIEHLAGAAEGKAFTVTPRRVVQWADLLARYTIFSTGSADASSLSREALSLMRWAYPTTSYEQDAEWGKVSEGLADIVEDAIEAFRSNVASRIEQIRALGARDATKKLTLIQEMTSFLQTAQTDLRRMGESDERVARAIEEMNGYIRQAVSGQL